MIEVEAHGSAPLIFQRGPNGMKTRCVILRYGKDYEHFDFLKITHSDSATLKEPKGLYMQVGSRFIDSGMIIPQITMELQKFKKEYTLNRAFLKREKGAQLELALGIIENNKFVGLDDDKVFDFTNTSRKTYDYNKIEDFNFTFYYRLFV